MIIYHLCIFFTIILILQLLWSRVYLLASSSAQYRGFEADLRLFFSVLPIMEAIQTRDFVTSSPLSMMEQDYSQQDLSMTRHGTPDVQANRKYSSYSDFEHNDRFLLNESQSSGKFQNRSTYDDGNKGDPEEIKHMGTWSSEQGTVHTQADLHGIERGGLDPHYPPDSDPAFGDCTSPSLDPTTADRRRPLLDKSKGWVEARRSELDLLVAKASLIKRFVNGPSPSLLPKDTSFTSHRFSRSGTPYNQKSSSRAKGNATHNDNSRDAANNSEREQSPEPPGDARYRRPPDASIDEGRFVCVCHQCDNEHECDKQACHTKYKFVSQLK